MAGEDGPTGPARHFTVTDQSSWNEVLAQYRHLVQRWHPDRHPEETRAAAQTQFIEITRAFQELRQQYQRDGRLVPAPEGTARTRSARPSIRPRPRRSTRLAALALSAVLATLITLALTLDAREDERRGTDAPSGTPESEPR